MYVFGCQFEDQHYLGKYAAVVDAGSAAGPDVLACIPPRSV
jgi:hypothetical protein